MSVKVGTPREVVGPGHCEKFKPLKISACVAGSFQIMDILQFFGVAPKTRPDLPINSILHSGGPKLKLSDLMLQREFYSQLLDVKEIEKDIEGINSLPKNLQHIDPRIISSISELYGEHGIFKLRMLATISNNQEFKYFYSMILSDVNAQGRSVLRSVTGDLGFPRAEMSESIRDNPNWRLSHAGVAIGDFALDP